jgi:hypothetical protein
MAKKQLMLQGFMVRPVVHLADFEDSTIEPVSVGEQMVTLKQWDKFLANQWPDIWASLNQIVEEQLAAQAEEAAAMAKAREFQDRTASKAHEPTVEPTVE